MFSVGNVSQNAARDSAEIPEDLIKELERRFHTLRDPFLMYDEDIEFHDAIRAMAMKQVHCDNNSSSSDDEEDCPKGGDIKIHNGSSEAEQDKKPSSTRARIRGFLRSIQVHLSHAAEQATASD
ncbi:hypothetical protein MAPG_07055 [Magnaporthiopsis poae ATCC 64411]|uniref:Uncharacterized protein n=1 Tax=Magnaporthiopsis poae (strain ATCC 64411 / 73-15) TaxID=644358 RepID=A0A0C4E3P0_MAGP6|nr:hypothetical protein MAPG_07055 [Magnaporthiopsis poae ATCC 64411]